jgi:hypothetical protein
LVRGTSRLLTRSNAELDWERQVGSVGTSLIPALDGCTNRTNDDGEVQGHWVAPLVCSFEAESFLFLLGKNAQTLVIVWSLGDKSTPLDEVPLILKTFFFDELVDIAHEIRIRKVGKRIADSVMVAV